MSGSTGTTLRTLWQHRALWWQFTKRQVELRHKGSHLGLWWSVLTPLLLLALYVLVFGFIFGGRFQEGATPESRIQYALMLLLGLAMHHFVAEVMTTGSGLVLTNPNFVKKVVFPLEILPAAAVGAAGVHFAITLALIFAGALASGSPISLEALWLPVILLPLFVGVFGLALSLAALGVFWRDLGQVTQFVVIALMFASAIFYPVSQIPPWLWGGMKFNPLLLSIDEARRVMFLHGFPNPLRLAYVYGIGIALFAIGSLIFARLRGAFADAL